MCPKLNLRQILQHRLIHQLKLIPLQKLIHQYKHNLTHSQMLQNQIISLQQIIVIKKMIMEMLVQVLEKDLHCSEL